jgi:multidrug efflux system membrane fusion protein
LDLAKINFARVESVTDQRAVSRQDYDAKKNAVAVAEAQLQQYQAAVENAQLNLDYCTIRSPINGRAGQRLVDIGNVVNANNTPLLVIQRLDPVYADFTIPENELTAVQQNMARGTLTTEVRLPDDSERPREGKLTFLDNSVQEGTGTVKLRATIENKDRRFWPGRFAQIRLVLSTRKNAVLIPAEGPQMSPKGPFVYVVKADSTAELRPVTVGQRQGDLVVVDKGLQAGERVVTNGQLGVTPGGKVSVAQPVAPVSQPAPAKPKGQS